MSRLHDRIERLEQRGESETAFLVLVGEPSAEQQSIIDQGKVRVLIQIPDNRRDHDRNQSKA